MKVYVADDFERKEKVREVHKKLHSMGYEISFDWTTHKFASPFSQNREMSLQYSSEDMEGVRNCDIFIMFHGEGKTKFIELGIAIEQNRTTGKPMIYVVGHADNNMVYSQPCIRLRNDIEPIYRELELLKSREF